MGDLGISTAPTAQNNKSAVARHMHGCFGVALVSKHAARVNGNTYSILNSLAVYTPEAEVPDVIARRQPKFILKTISALHDGIPGTFTEEWGRTADFDCDL